LPNSDDANDCVGLTLTSQVFLRLYAAILQITGQFTNTINGIRV